MATEPGLTHAYTDQAFCYGADPIALPVDYESLIHLPRINHLELKQDRTIPETAISHTQIDELFE